MARRRLPSLLHVSEEGPRELTKAGGREEAAELAPSVGGGVVGAHRSLIHVSKQGPGELNEAGGRGDATKLAALVLVPISSELRGNFVAVLNPVGLFCSILAEVVFLVSVLSQELGLRELAEAGGQEEGTQLVPFILVLISFESSGSPSGVQSWRPR